jgi:hypothetical protein
MRSLWQKHLSGRLRLLCFHRMGYYALLLELYAQGTNKKDNKNLGN